MPGFRNVHSRILEALCPWAIGIVRQDLMPSIRARRWRIVLRFSYRDTSAVNHKERDAYAWLSRAMSETKATSPPGHHSSDAPPAKLLEVGLSSFRAAPEPPLLPRPCHARREGGRRLLPRLRAFSLKFACLRVLAAANSSGEPKNGGLHITKSTVSSSPSMPDRMRGVED